MSNPKFSVGERVINIHDNTSSVIIARDFVRQSMALDRFGGELGVYTGYLYQTDDWCGQNEFGDERWSQEPDLRPIPKEQSVSWVYFAATVGWSPYEDLTGSFPVKEVV